MSSEWFQRFCRLPAAVLSDCLQGKHTLDSSIRCMTPGHGLAGPAFTVLAEGGSIITLHKSLKEAPHGSVLVVGGSSAEDLNSALFGKLMAIDAKAHGIQGLVVDGPIRDIAEIREMGFHVFARCTATHVGRNRTVGQTQAPTLLGDVIVHSGSYLRSDDDGVTIVPVEELEKVVAAAEQRLRKEDEYKQAMKAGEHITDLIGFTRLIYQENEPYGRADH
jgi:4-hydroxy-4-methyl-2-oxoglutarate aldolase